MKYKIADLVFEIEGKLSPVLSSALIPYMCDEAGDYDVFVSIKINNDIFVDSEPTDVISKRNWVVTGNEYITYDTESISGDCVMKTVADKHWSDVSIEINDLNEKFGIKDDYYMFNVLGEIFRTIILCHDGIILHSSAISYKDNGLLFSAPSGTGKSTHTGLWKKVFGDDVVYINDDTPALRLIDGCVYMYGTPWAGTTGINANKKVPLKGIVFINRGEDNRIRKTNVVESINLLINETRKPMIEDMIKLSLERIETLIKCVPMYMLYCTISEEAVYTVKNEIGL